MQKEIQNSIQMLNEKSYETTKIAKLMVPNEIFERQVVGDDRSSGSYRGKLKKGNNANIKSSEINKSLHKKSYGGPVANKNHERRNS